MTLSYILQDEKGLGGQQIAIIQGEIKTIQVFWLKANGAPFVKASVSELTVHVAKAGGYISKTLGAATVALISSTELGGAIGFSFSLTAADTALMAISSTIAMSAKVQVSTTAVDDLDCPSAFNVTAAII